jgi:hypothetical protein
VRSRYRLGSRHACRQATTRTKSDRATKNTTERKRSQEPAASRALRDWIALGRPGDLTENDIDGAQELQRLTARSAEVGAGETAIKHLFCLSALRESWYGDQDANAHRTISANTPQPRYSRV